MPFRQECVAGAVTLTNRVLYPRRFVSHSSLSFDLSPPSLIHRSIEWLVSSNANTNTLPVRTIARASRRDLGVMQGDRISRCSWSEFQFERRRGSVVLATPKDAPTRQKTLPLYLRYRPTHSRNLSCGWRRIGVIFVGL